MAFRIEQTRQFDFKLIKHFSEIVMEKLVCIAVGVYLSANYDEGNIFALVLLAYRSSQKFITCPRRLIHNIIATILKLLHRNLLYQSIVFMRS